MQAGEGTSRGRRLASPAWVVAIAAMVAALAGTAVAVDKITSSDIAPNAVRSKHIKDKQVKTRDADLVKFRKVEAALVTETTTRVDAGPEITGQAKAGDLLHIHARVDIERLSGAAGCGVFLGVQGAGSGESGANILTGSAASPERRWMNTGSSGTLEKHEAVVRSVPVADSGPYRISLGFYSGNGSTDCSFTDRNLWVEQVR